MRRVMAMLAAMLSLAGAGNAVAATRPADPLAAFEKSCQTQMYMSAPACACMVAKAKTDGYTLLGSKADQVRQVGNSVSPLVAKALCQAIAEAA